MSGRLVVDKPDKLSSEPAARFRPANDVSEPPSTLTEVSTWDRFFSDCNLFGCLFFRRLTLTASGNRSRIFVQKNARIREEIVTFAEILNDWVT
ncbi:MAG TPA: hypothetical protein VHR72_09840 [Gemmataceae bacterium]|jgi:hypothetical protein|nr:hypothetical protein [Gemmataceae bacterium]